MHKQKNKSGFTLVELLVVISIIALLVSILMPALGQARKQAQTVVCKTNLKQWGMCKDLYLADSDDLFWTGNAGRESNWWMTAMRSYMDDIDKMRCCPTAVKQVSNIDGTPGPGFGKQPFAAWGQMTYLGSTEAPVEDGDSGQGKSWDDYGSYGASGWLENFYSKSESQKTMLRGLGFEPLFWNKGANISHPSTVPFMTDAQWVDFYPNTDSYTGFGPPPTENEVWYGSYGGTQFSRLVQNRHGGKQNVAFADSSVRTVMLPDLWTLKWNPKWDMSVNPPFPEWMD